MSLPHPPHLGEGRIYRPGLTRKFAYGLGGFVWLSLIVAALVMPYGGKFGFPISDRILLVLFGGVIFWFAHRQADVNVRAGETLRVQNLLRSREVPWHAIEAVRFPEGDAWARLDLHSGESIAMMAFQRSDGEHALRGARELQALVRDRNSY
ncbi:PH domain-containing protein [Dermabacteraceae bacterium P7074]